MSAGDGMQRIRLTSEELSCELLPEFGGKIASLVWRANGAELLQAPLGAYRRRAEHGGWAMPFDQSDAGGWDECVPSVAACAAGTGQIPGLIPDHGDLWGVPWQVVRGAGAEVELCAEAISLPLRLTRRAVLSGAELALFYTLENIGTDTVTYLWSAHPLFAVEAGDRLRLPPEVRALRVEGSKHGRLGAAGTWLEWPLAKVKQVRDAQEHAAGRDTQDQMVDLSVAQASSADTGDKLFAQMSDEGWAEIERRSVGVRLRMEFDPAATPYLGLWLCYGGWPEAGPRQQCIALEPTTAPCDSLAEAVGSGCGSRLMPGESRRWWVRLRVEAI